MKFVELTGTYGKIFVNLELVVKIEPFGDGTGGSKIFVVTPEGADAKKLQNIFVTETLRDIEALFWRNSMQIIR